MSRLFEGTLQPGVKVKVYYNENNINNQIRHIRAIVDTDWVVYRVWSKRKRMWCYRIDHIYAFELLKEDGHLYDA